MQQWRTPAAHDGGGDGSHKWEILGPDRTDLQLTLTTQVSWVEQEHIPAPMFPTPLVTDAPDHGGPPNKNTHNRQWGGENSLGQMAKQGQWPTPRASDGSKGGSPTNDNLPAEVKRWPTPAARDAKDAGTEPSQWARHTPGLSIQVNMWPTPTVNGNHNRAEYPTAGGDGLETAVKRWPTPMAHDGARNRVTTTAEMQRETPHLWAVVQSQAEKNWPTPGASRTGGADSHGQMPEAFRGGLLNPRWVEWLMGIPIGWTGLGPLATESYRQLWRGFLNCSEGSND